MLTIDRILLQPETPDINEQIRLTPVQQSAAGRLMKAVSKGSVLMLRGDAGAGKTTILNYILREIGGVLTGMRHFVDMLMLRRPDAIEQSFIEIIETALTDHEIVFVDDLHLITAITANYDYDRRGLLDAAMEAVAARAVEQGHKLIFATNREDSIQAFESRAWRFDIGDYASEDYASLCRTYLDEDIAAGLDYSRIFRFAPKLNGHQIRKACLWHGYDAELDTGLFIDYLISINAGSNVDLEEVQPVTLKDLKGLDDVIEALEAKIVLPFENVTLAAELELKPKRGVLLAGPPGTGKTTIGRALAHRLKGKFFLIDGTVIADSRDFYCQICEIFERAKRNAPSVIFIDDADLIFEGNSKGFYRYLLTMLDGLESASNERVCVMMTAMEIANIPAALVRSGRVELWLQTRLPDLDAREAILRARLAKLGVDTWLLAEASKGMTGADLKAMAEDGKLLFAHDKARGKQLRPIHHYFLDAIDTIRSNRRNYEKKKAIRVTESVPCGFVV